MHGLILGLLVGFLMGLVTAIFIDTGMRLREDEDSPWISRWVRFRVFVLYLWERKAVYLTLLAVCLAAGLLIGSLSFLPGVEEGQGSGSSSWATTLRHLLR